MKMHKNNLVKRGFAVLLALALCIGMMPVMAVAKGDGRYCVGCMKNAVYWVDQVNPTCEQEGVIAHYSCLSCSRNYNVGPAGGLIWNSNKVERIAKLDHSYTGDLIVTEEGHARLCVNGCGGHEELQAHTFGEWKVESYATCGTDGKQTRTCTACEFTETKNISATKKHSEAGPKIVKEATCTTPGSKEYFCAVCHTVLRTEEIPVNPNAHDFSGPYVPTGTGNQHWHACLNGCGAHDTPVAHKMVEDNREPTCKEPGHTGGTCTDCGFSNGKDIPALQHKWTIHDKKAPTCTENGFDNVHCQYCGMKSATESKEIPSSGHKYTDWQVDVLGYLTHSHTCEVCGEKETSEHNFTVWTVTSEDEVSKVESRVCEDCGYKETKTTSKVCRHPATETRKEHQDATCVTAGYDVTICGVCGAEVERHDIPARGHTYDAWTDNGEENHIHTCVNEGCTAGTEGHAVTAAHDFSEWETTAYPTYGIPGREERACATCGREESREIPALVGPPVIPPPVVVPEEPDEPIEDPDVPLNPTPEEPDEPIEEPDVPLDPAPEEPDEPIEEPDVPLDPTPEEPDEPIEEPDVPLNPTPDEPVDEPDVPLNPAPEEPAGGNGNGGSGANDEEILEDGEIPLADVPKTSDDLSLLWILVLACGATLMARCLSRKERTQR